MYKVLIAEDEPLVRKGLSVMIGWEKLNCVLTAAVADGLEGVEAIKTHRPHIVITDIAMPKKDGLKMIKETIEEYLYSAIILTGYDDFSYAKTSLHFGVCEYLLKPIQLEELEQAIQKAIQIFNEKAHYQQLLLLKEGQENIALIPPVEHIGDELVKNIIACIAEEYADKLTIGSIAEKLKYSEALLNKRFKSACGQTINEYLNRYRIQQAICCLRSGIHVTEAAEQCGFSDVKYFYTVFKKYIGYSPKEFVKLLKGV